MFCESDLDECSTGTHACIHGDCVNNIGGYTCSCVNGWEGVNCATDINECQEQGHGCLNGATCENTVGSYVCVCGAGWAGDDCGVNIDECASNPCRNGGACVDTIGGFQCDCSGTVYVGITCEIGWTLITITLKKYY